MSRRHTRIKLPRYLRGKRDKDGAMRYFWELPSWARPPAERAGRKCPVESAALGTDLAAAIAKADRILLAFDEWRLGVTVEAVKGTVAALFADYRKLDRFTRLAGSTRRDYAAVMSLICDVALKTMTFGEMRAEAVKAKHADAVVAHISKTRGARTARYAMQVARRAWNERNRDSGGANPFAGMGLSHKAEKGNRQTSRAEYDTFRRQARELGLQSLATAAALSFELVRRVSDVFGYIPRGEAAETAGGIFWEDYQPGGQILLRQHKTGRVQLLPLRGDPDPDSEDGEERTLGPLLYPDLEEELARTPRGAPDTEIDGQPMTPIVIEERTGKRYTIESAGVAFRKVRAAAKLPTEMTLTGFRHGGATELGDAGVEDIRPVSGHATRAMADIYDKVTIAKARAAAATRRSHVKSGKKDSSGR